MDTCGFGGKGGVRTHKFESILVLIRCIDLEVKLRCRDSPGEWRLGKASPGGNPEAMKYKKKKKKSDDGMTL